MIEFFEIFWPVFVKTLAHTTAVGAFVFLCVIAGLILWLLGSLVARLVHFILEGSDYKVPPLSKKDEDEVRAIQYHEERPMPDSWTGKRG